MIIGNRLCFVCDRVGYKKTETDIMLCKTHFEWYQAEKQNVLMEYCLDKALERANQMDNLMREALCSSANFVENP